MRRIDPLSRKSVSLPAAHPLRRIRIVVNEALVKMDGLLSSMYEG